MKELNTSADNLSDKPVPICASLREMMSGHVMNGDVIQLGPGMDEGSIEAVQLGKSRFSKVRFEPKALVQTEQVRDMVHFTVPVFASEMWSVNGAKLSTNAFLINFGRTESEIVASHRDSFCGRIPSGRFMEELRVLGGERLVNQIAPTVVMRLTAAELQTLAQTLEWLMQDAEAGGDAPSIERDLIRTLAVAVSIATVEQHLAPMGVTRKGRLVRHARELYAENENDMDTMSVADLCHATGVSAPTLINAFRDVTGETPARFFALQRLAHARDDLVRSEAVRSRVKTAALNHGFTDLGRFGRLYQSIYGVLPSQV